MSTKPVALVTGSSRGIGRAVAIALSQSGYRLILTARDETALKETGRSCGGEETVILPMDLSEKDSPKRLADAVKSEIGQLDVLVNNAGIVLSKSFEDTGAADWDRMLNLNARAPFLLTRMLLPLLRASAVPTVVNIGSVVSFKGYERQAAYTASKHALAGWTKVLAREEASAGIRVHLIAPGGVATDLVRHVRPDIDESDLIAPEDVANMVQFLTTHRSNAVIDVVEMHRAGKTPFS